MNLLVIGGTGLLGNELKKIDSKALYFGRELDIINSDLLFEKLDNINPDIILHLAAITNSVYVDKNRIETIQTNIIGTANVANWCIKNNKRLVFVSTDYVYDGSINKQHDEDEPLKPNNLYATSKLAGECSTSFVENHCIIRTSFGNSKFAYDTAYTNLKVSKDYVDIIAPKILKVVLSDYVGIINIGTNPKSMFEYAKLKNHLVKESQLEIDKNFSLNIELYKKLFE